MGYLYRINKTKVMNSLNSNITISSIIYDMQDTNVLIQAEQRKNHLSFESKFMVSFSELNVILNELQKGNPEMIISDLFVEEKLGQGYIQYFLNGRKLTNSTISISQYLLETPKKQIRA